MKALLLKVNPRKPEWRKIRIAANAIRNGGLVVFPTETVYGIGADALNPRACMKIYRAKGRALDNPLIVHVSSIGMAENIAIIPDKYKKIIKKIWPSPLTLVLKARSTLPRVVTANLDTVCVRMPENRVALALIKESGVPIAAPSANISSKPSSTSAAHALKYFESKVDIILDSGRSEYGVESSILDIRNFKLLRAGAFTAEDIERIFNRKPVITKETRGISTSGKAITPGMKYKHYSPGTPLFMFNGSTAALDALLEKSGRSVAFIGSREACRKIHNKHIKKLELGSEKDLKEVASNMFDALIKVDSLGVELAVVETFEEKGHGLAIMNRLRRASENREFSNLKELRDLLKESSLATS